DHGFDGQGHFRGHVFVRNGAAGPKRNVDFRDTTFDFIDNGNHGRFRDAGDGKAGRFQFLGTETVSSDVNTVVHAAENTEIAVFGKQRSITREVGPILPAFALGIPAIFLVILADEFLAVAPDGLNDSRPGIADAKISGPSGTGGHFLIIFIVNDHVNPGKSGASAAGLHGIERGDRAAQDATGFRLPPGVDDRGFAFSHNIVIPSPNVRLDGFSYRGHVLEVEIVLGRLVRAHLSEHPDRGGRGVKYIYI